MITSKLGHTKWDEHPPIIYQVVNSAITQPCEGQKMAIIGRTGEERSVEVSGWAHGDGKVGS